jgi:hypothetical protein
MKPNFLLCFSILLICPLVTSAQQIVGLDKSEVHRGDKVTIQLKDAVQDAPIIRLKRRECYDGTRESDACHDLSFQSQSVH